MQEDYLEEWLQQLMTAKEAQEAEEAAAQHARRRVDHHRRRRREGGGARAAAAARSEARVGGRAGALLAETLWSLVPAAAAAAPSAGLAVGEECEYIGTDGRRSRAC